MQMRATQLLMFSMCSSAFGHDESSISLLQTQATRRHSHTSLEDGDTEWAKGFNQCREKPIQKANSGCRANTKKFDIPVEAPQGVDPKKLKGRERNQMLKGLTAKAVRECSLKAKEVGADTFDFLYGLTRMRGGHHAVCVTKSCFGSNLRYKTDKKVWSVYSKYCGLQMIARNLTGPCGEETTHYLKYLPPPVHACDAPLNFGAGMKNNNLNGLGPGKGAKSMRYRKILTTEEGEPVDLVVKASDTYLPASTKKNGRYKMWGGSVNLKSGTETHFKFQFVKSNGQTPVRVPSFMFTMFDLDQSKGCLSRTTINATGYSSYFLSEDTELRVTTKLPKLMELKDAQNRSTGKWFSTPVSTQFQSTQLGNKADNPKDPMNLTAQQAARSVTLVYQNVKFFSLGFQVTGGEHSGRNIVFGGSSSITNGVCDEAHKKLDEER